MSVVLPTWRRYASGTLQRAVDSVLTQCFRDLELIVVDDGSTDGSWDYLQKRQAKDPRVVLIRHERNSGLPAIRVNEGIEVSRGRYLAFQFDDDEWVDGALEMLVSRAESLSEPSVVYGEALLIYPDGHEVRFPGVPMDLRYLFRQNRLMNNSVLIPRPVLERFGLYDCHIGMRRLCDWDLWIRLLRRVPFVAAGGLVSRTYVARDDNSIGVIAPFDLSLVRFLMSLPRGYLLSLNRWRDYEIDALCVGGVEVPGVFRERLVTEQIRPYRQRQGLRDSSDGEPTPARSLPRPAPQVLACVHDGFYPGSDLCFGQYDDATRARGTFVRFEQLVDQLAATWPTEVDLLLLVRNVTQPAPEVARRAVAEGLPSAFYLDDDYLSLHEHGPPFDEIAPGQPFHSNLVSALKQVDAVWATSPVIAESVRPHNARIVPHNGAVAEAWLAERLRPRGLGGRIRIAHAGGSYRIQEFEGIWEGLRQFAREYSDQVEFQFWGVDVAGLPELEAPTTHVPYTYSYIVFMEQLRGAGIDILLTPLLDHPRPRLAKAPNKYYDVAAAGAFGIFSDVAPYARLPGGLTCLKPVNTPEAWYEALREAVRMPEERFDLMRRRLIEHVRLEYTETAQIDLHEAACRATEFHRRTRLDRHGDGRPRVLVPSTTDPRAQPELEALLRRYGIEPVEVPSEDRAAGPDLDALLAREKPALALVSREPSTAAKALRERGFPVVRVPEVAMEPDSFARGLLRLLRDTGAEESMRSRQVVALPGKLEDVTGKLSASHGDAVTIRWFDAGEPMDVADIDVLVAGEGDAGLLARSAAEGALRVIVPGSGSLDGAREVSAIVAHAPPADAVAEAIRRALDLPSADRLALRVSAYRAVRARAHPDALANALLGRFNDTLAKREPSRPSSPSGKTLSGSGRPEPPAHEPSTARTRLKGALERVGLYRPLSRLYWKTRPRRVLVVQEDPSDPRGYAGPVLRELEAALGRPCILRAAADVDPCFLYSFEFVVFIGSGSEKSLEILGAARIFGCATVYVAAEDLVFNRVVESLLRRIDLILAPSEAAVPILRRFHPNVVSIAPYEIRTPGELSAPRHPDLVTIGIAEPPGDEEELLPLVPAVSRLLDARRTLRIEFFGLVPKELAMRDEITVHPWERDYGPYREKLEGFGWDIGLAPLSDTERNRCRSNARYREYASAGIAGLYSDAPVFRDTVVHGRTGLIVPHRDSRAWYDAIVALSTDEGLRRSLAAAALEDVRKNYRREDHARRLADLLESLRPPRRRRGIG